MRWTQKAPCWKRWFAWYPVEIGEQWVWLEWIERRLLCDCHELRLIQPTQEPAYCCDQMRGGMWIDGKYRPEWCPVHNPRGNALSPIPDLPPA